MNNNFKLRVPQIVFFLLIFFLSRSISQTLISFSPVYESQNQDILKRVFVENDKLICKINNSIISTFNLEGKLFSFLEGADGSSFALIKYFFGQKSDKSNFELYLLDENFAVSFYRKFEFYYEEPLPKILVLNKNQFLSLYSASGKLKLFSNSKETEIDLLKEDGQEFNQERIGNVIPYNGKVLITLSQLKKNEKLISKIFLLNPETLETESFEIDLAIIYKLFVQNSEIYLTGIEIGTTFKTGFYLLELKTDKFTSSELERISDEFIEGRVKNSDILFFGRNCFYSLGNKSLEKTTFCLEKETILDALSSLGFIFVLTREELNSNLYKLDKRFNILERESIEKYLTKPELKISLDNKLYLIDRNKTILVKNFSEE